MPSANISETPHTHCPLCGEPLGSNPNECSKCDWVKGYRQPKTSATNRDLVAALLSIIPGMGHIYKGHTMTGWLFFFGTAIAGAVAGLAGFASAGWGGLLFFIYPAWVMMLAYWSEDLKVTGGRSKTPQ